MRFPRLRLPPRVRRWALACGVTAAAAGLAAALHLRSRPAVSCDLLLENAVVHDGAGTPGHAGAVAVTGDRITAVFDVLHPRRVKARLRIDLGGADLSPGFIDAHSHADLSILGTSGPIRADNFAGQGVTTVVVGNCGRSAQRIGDLARSVAARGSNVNVASLVGLSTLRQAVVGGADRAASPEELRVMEAMVEQAMRDGALGVSTGYAYAPGRFARPDEVAALLGVAARRRGVHATHLRDEGAAIVEALREAVAASQAARIPLVVSHFKIAGRPPEGTLDVVEALLREAGRGPSCIPVHVDQYPYDASSTGTDVYLPDWFVALERSGRRAVLAEKGKRARLADDVGRKLRQEGWGDLSFAHVASYAPRRAREGRSIREIAAEESGDPTPAAQMDVFLDLVAHGGAQMVYRNIPEDVLHRIPRRFTAMVGTDAAIRFDTGGGVPHPRGWGAFPRYLAEFVRARGLLPLDEAIRRITSEPARVFRLTGRGRLEEGAYADLVAFDAALVQDRATLASPLLRPTGFLLVVVNGVVVAEAGAPGEGQAAEALDLRAVLPGRFLQAGRASVAPALPGGLAASRSRAAASEADGFGRQGGRVATLHERPAHLGAASRLLPVTLVALGLLLGTALASLPALFPARPTR